MTFFIESLQAFILARPPIVAFICSLIGITLSIFLVAFYIKDKDVVLDTHAQEDWNSLRKYLNGSEYCIDMSHSDEFPRISTEIRHNETVATDSLEGMCFPVIVNIHGNQSQFTKLANAARLEGLVSLNDWERSCTNLNSQLEKSESVGLTLVIPAGLPYSQNVSAWVYLSGLPHPANMHFSSLCQTVNVPSQVIGKLISYDFLQSQSNSKTNRSVCQPDELIKLYYISSPAPEVYLTREDKVQIYLHLLQIGCVFLVILFMLLVSGVIQGRTFVLTRRHTLLPTKEIS